MAGEPLTASDDNPATAVVLEIARGLHEAGTPSDSLEAALGRLAGALQLNLNAMVHPTAITAAIGRPGEQSVTILRLDPGAVNLDRLARLNQIVDQLCAGTISPHTALIQVRAVLASARPFPSAVVALSYGASASAVAVLLGGGWAELATAAVIGTVVGVVAGPIAGQPNRRPLFEVIASAIAALIALIAGRFVPALSTYTTIAAGLAILLPGLNLTTAIGELATRNLVSGTARLGGVFATLISLTAGVALGTALGQILGGRVSLADPTALPDWILLPVILVAAFGFGVNLNGRLADMRWIVPFVALAVGVTRLTEPLEPEAAAFVSALALGLGGAGAARIFRLPAEVLILPGLIVLVPGVIGYQSLLKLLQDDVQSGVTFFFNALLTAVLLVAGLLFAQILTPRQR
ncbi:MAG: membrane protein [Dehalococcoidia bacterium]|nr:MAG: membrane protein [Dehalococcoidia bacterium]